MKIFKSIKWLLVFIGGILAFVFINRTYRESRNQVEWEGEKEKLRQNKEKITGLKATTAHLKEERKKLKAELEEDCEKIKQETLEELDNEFKALGL